MQKFVRVALRCLWLVLVVGHLAGCPKPCQSVVECDDGLWCNGPETCQGGVCKAGVAPTCDDGLACTQDVCAEDRRTCIHKVADVDGDGFGDLKCVDATLTSLGSDCDDHDANRFPGNREVCDTHDEDCDDSTLGGKDNDGDGYVDSHCTNPTFDGGTVRGLDCNDANEGIHPGQLESCNNADDNCNGQVDEGVRSLRFADADHDGWGAGAGTMGCNTDPGTSDVGTDCDDTNPAMHPGAFRCIQQQSKSEYELCTVDGGTVKGNCGQLCSPQPNGTAICL